MHILGGDLKERIRKELGSVRHLAARLPIWQIWANPNMDPTNANLQVQMRFPKKCFDVCSPNSMICCAIAPFFPIQHPGGVKAVVATDGHSCAQGRFPRCCPIVS